MRGKARLAPLAALALVSGCGCAPDVHHARLGDGAGLTEHAPVLVSGVEVGHVESVRVIDSSVDVAFVLEGDHQVTLRADTCAMAMRHAAPESGTGEAPPRTALVIVPGQEAPLAEERPIPECHLAEDALTSLMQTFGQGFDSLVRAIQQQQQPRPGSGGAGAGGSGGGAAAGGGTAGGGTSGAPTPPVPPFPLPSPLSGGPLAGGPLSGAPQSPPRAPGVAACDALRVRGDGNEPVAALPLLLPAGGTRAFFVFENASDRSVQIAPITEATFSDAGGRAIAPAQMPGAADDWFMPFDVPAQGSRRVGVVMQTGAPAVDRVEIRAVAFSDDVLDRCTLQVSGLAPAP